VELSASFIEPAIYGGFGEDSRQNGGLYEGPRMSTWTIAAVQMDVLLGRKADNLAVIRAHLRDAAARGARLVVFPECALTGYGFEGRDEALAFAETVPGPATAAVAADCAGLGVWAAFGLLERGGDSLFNACALVGPAGQVLSYRKIHLPFMGVDRFATPGDRPFAVHDLGGLRVGLAICYDGSFPESARVLALLGADLVLLPTNWPAGARPVVCHLVPARALENHIYYAAVNRVGEEAGFRFMGSSRVLAPDGEPLAIASEDRAEILVATIDPAVARCKRLVKVPGGYEVDRVHDRRPEMYGPLTQPMPKPNDD
jgi:predicted amidohydrolase